MGDIHVERTHTLGLEEAKTRAQDLVEKFTQKLSHLIKDTTWNADGTHGTASGKIFSADFIVSETSVSVDIALKGIAAKVMKGQIEKTMKEQLDRKFN